MDQVTRYRWTFKRRFRAKVLGWHSSRLGIDRLKQAISEINSVARRDPALAADGVVGLIERIWPTFEHVDSSSGALGSAVRRTLNELIPILVRVRVDQRIRDRWLNRLWRAILNDGVSYLSLVEEAWGELCGSSEVASYWADTILPMLRSRWSDSRPGDYVRGTDLCLSSLLRAGRHKELLDLLALKDHPIWPWRRYGIRALLAEGDFDNALTYAEASRGLNIPDSEIDAECEAILLVAGRRDAAYHQYALTANGGKTGLETFRRIAKKYPEIDAKQILTDLAQSGGNPGKWFAAAKDAGYLDLASDFAKLGRTDPLTLSRASRDFLKSNPAFAFHIARLAVEGILAGDGYEITRLDLVGAVEHFLAAARRIGAEADAARELNEIIASHYEAPSFVRTRISWLLGEPLRLDSR